MIIFDASALILLTKVDLLNRVVEEFQVTITSIVAEECTRKEELFDAKLIKAFILQGKIRVHETTIAKEGRMLAKAFNMGDGETSSLLLAKTTDSILATDDGQAIKTCKVLQIPLLTAIHFLLSLNQKRILKHDLALAKLKLLEKFGRYNQEIIRHASEQIRRR